MAWAKSFYPNSYLGIQYLYYIWTKSLYHIHTLNIWISVRQFHDVFPHVSLEWIFHANYICWFVCHSKSESRVAANCFLSINCVGQASLNSHVHKTTFQSYHKFCTFDYTSTFLTYLIYTFFYSSQCWLQFTNSTVHFRLPVQQPILCCYHSNTSPVAFYNILFQILDSYFLKLISQLRFCQFPYLPPDCCVTSLFYIRFACSDRQFDGILTL